MLVKLALAVLLSFCGYVSPATAHDSDDEELFDDDTVPAYETRGSISLLLAKFLVDAEILRDLLPRGLELAPRPELPEGKHFLVFGVVETKTDYLEINQQIIPTDPAVPTHRFRVSVPVRIIGGTEEYTYSAHVYSDSKIGRLLERAYGVDVDKARFDPVNGIIKSRYGKTLTVVETTPVVNFDQAAFDRNFAFVKRTLGGLSISKRGGQWLCLLTEYDFSQAIAQPVETKWFISRTLDGDIKGIYSGPGLDSSRFGGVSLQARRAHSGPVACQ